MPIDPVLAPLIFKAGTDFLSSFGGTKKKSGGLFGIEEFVGKNPLLTGGAIAGVSALYRAIQPDRAAQIYGSVLIPKSRRATSWHVSHTGISQPQNARVSAPPPNRKSTKSLAPLRGAVWAVQVQARK